MKVCKFEDIAIIESIEDKEIFGESIKIDFAGVPDGTLIKAYKNGLKETCKKYSVQNGFIKTKVEPAKYTICIEDSQIKFTVYEQDSKLYLKRSKEDPEKSVEKMFRLCMAMLRRINKQDEKIENMTGYDPE